MASLLTWTGEPTLVRGSLRRFSAATECDFGHGFLVAGCALVVGGEKDETEGETEMDGLRFLRWHTEEVRLRRGC
ncbi:hypothetical protein L484_000040 [Morus notabilis]|uniref:Uncharacterized protein n=1 Tax=Morus notabilis TaxID=981085 RepID=W9SDT7_9ROSA|nr:hypothetical protein L484_024978 [Morus notabilis]EXC39138.1 hypothetical protein L484_000040 [Morus notabilis]